MKHPTPPAVSRTGLHGRWGRLPLVLLWACRLLADPAPVTVPLWPGDAPGSGGRHEPEVVRITDGGDHVVTGVHQPDLSVHLPTAPQRPACAVVILPGGGHRELWMDHEGHHVARYLQARGVAAFVLKYRLARATNSPYSIADHAVPDVRRAIRLVRARAEEWSVDPARLGVLGFSAGGELAWQASALPAPGNPDAADPVERQEGRPTFQALIYPGRSDDIRPTPGVPPVFLAAGERDRPDISRGLPQVYLRFREAGVSAELHLYANVGHGFGLRPGRAGAAAGWVDRLLDWMQANGWTGP